MEVTPVTLVVGVTPVVGVGGVGGHIFMHVMITLAAQSCRVCDAPGGCGEEEGRLAPCTVEYKEYKKYKKYKEYIGRVHW